MENIFGCYYAFLKALIYFNSFYITQKIEILIRKFKNYFK